MKSKDILLPVLLLLTIAASSQKSPVFAPQGVAIRGYDPVAFFTQKAAMMGADSLRFNWQETEWHFANTENLELFKSDPEKYAPQFGGYCAYGTAEGHKAPTEVDTWTVVDDKLYFNYNRKVQAHWIKNQPALILKAEEQWPLIKNKE